MWNFRRCFNIYTEEEEEVEVGKKMWFPLFIWFSVQTQLDIRSLLSGFLPRLNTYNAQNIKKRFMCLCLNQTVADHRRLNFQSHRGRYSRSIRSCVFAVSSLKLCLHERKKKFMRLRSILSLYTIFFLWFRFKTTRIPNVMFSI